jgi:hypothetical protein
MSDLNGVCGFYHDPNVGVNLAWSGEAGLHLNHGESPKVFGGSFKNIIDTCSIPRACPPHTSKHPFSLSLRAG